MVMQIRRPAGSSPIPDLLRRLEASKARAPFDDHKAAFLRALGIDNRAGRQDYQVSTVSSVRDHPPPWPAGDVCDHSAQAGRHIRSGLRGQSALAGDVYDHSRPIGRSGHSR